MSSSQDKNLPATARRLHKARADGQSARSRDAVHLAVLGVGAAALWVLAPSLAECLARALRQSLVFDAASVRAPAVMLEQLKTLAMSGVLLSAAFAALTATAAILGALGGGGWVFSSKPVAPQWGRLNPLRGIANLFARQQLVNVLKMVLMTALLSLVALQFMQLHMHDLAPLMLQPSPRSLRDAAQWLASGLQWPLLVVLLFALVDVPLQAVLFKSRLKMTHEELKNEHKEADGVPQTKGRIRQKQREIADRASISAVPKADFVLMNPSHYAVALRYDQARMQAPQVVSKGADVLALRIREVARQHGIPILQAPMLARALYAHAQLEQPIPAQLYAAVAQVLAYIWRLKAAMQGASVVPGAQPDPAVPPELDPHSPHAQRPPRPRRRMPPPHTPS